MIQGFKTFITRGNVIDLAIAVVIGTAFAKVIDTVIGALVNPILARIGGANAGEGLGIQLGDEGNADTFINIGAIINALIVFLLTALVVYFVFVVPMNKMIERRNRGKDVEEDVEENTELLREIRDLLKRG